MTLTPFKINVPQRKLDTIRAQLELAEIGCAPEDDSGWKYGTDARYLSEFRDYWLNRYRLAPVRSGA
jgi:microsomal epoxide hydrolase